MENATKALLIAGGILLALITLSILVYSYNQLNWFQNLNKDSKEVELTEKYNAEYEVYNKKIMYGTELISIINKANSHNETRGIEKEPENDYYIDVEFELQNALVSKFRLNKRTYSIKNDNAYINNTILKRDDDSNSLFYEFKLSVFKCTGLEYNKSGRISKIKLSQIKVEEQN